MDIIETDSPPATTAIATQASDIIPIIAVIFGIVTDILIVNDIEYQTIDVNLAQLSLLLLFSIDSLAGALYV